MIASSTSRPSNRSLGIVYTPAEIARAVVAEVIEDGDRIGAILEPSVGDGAFLGALSCHGLLGRVTAFDVDDLAVERVRERFPSVDTREADFLAFSASTNERFDVIVGNPPYVRRKNFTQDAKREIEALANRQNYPLADLKNVWAAFVVASEALLAQSGRLAFVVPYELMNVDYGVALQRWLTRRFERLDVYIPDEKAFKQIDQDAVLLVARKRSAEPGAFVRRVANLVTLDSRPLPVDFTASRHTSINLKTFLLEPDVLDRLRMLTEGSPTVSDYCRSGAGIVTAANDYFILSDEDVETHALGPWSRPILKKSAYLGPGPVLSKADFDRLRQSYPANFIDFNDYDEAFPDPAVELYLKKGRAAGVPSSFKARHRHHWFKVAPTWIGQGFFFKRSHAFPRICVNDAGVHVTDAAYSLNPVAGATMRGICYSFYNTVTMLMAEVEGRFYGGGVLELTPNEFRRLPLFYTEPSEEEFADFANPAGWSDPARLALNGDAQLIANHGFKEDELALLHAAWKVLRNHRLRHGSQK